MHWELWDTESGNMVGDYASEADALTVVRDALRRHGSSVVASLALGAEHDDDLGDDDNLPPVISGQDLAARALGDSPGQATARRS
jgi:hypothetical protein